MTFDWKTARLDKADIKRDLPVAFVLHEYGHNVEPVGDRLVALCPFHSETNPSFDVYGAELERWGCYPCGIGGDVLDLIGRLDPDADTFHKQMSRAADLLTTYQAGSWAPPEVQSTGRSLDLESAQGYVTAALENTDAVDNLMVNIVDRNPALGDMDAGWLRQEFSVGSSGGEVVIPYYNRAGALVTYKHRRPDGKALSAGGSDFSGVLYGEWRDTDHDKTVILSEGETDAWAVAFHLPAFVGLGLPTGAGAHPRQKDALAGRRVILAFDGDDAGRKALRRWAIALNGVAEQLYLLPMPDGQDLAGCTDLPKLVETIRPLTMAPDNIRADHDCYVRPGKENDTPLSNWRFEPKVELRGDDGLAYEGILWPSGQPVSLTSHDLSSKARVVSWSLKHGGAWYGMDRDAQQLLGLLQAEGPFLAPGKLTTVAGLHDGHFVWPGDRIGPDNWHYIDPPNTVHLADRMDLPPWDDSWQPHRLVELLDLHAPAVMHPLLSWLAVAPLRSLLHEFPILAVTGSSGSGKTTLLDMVLREFTGTSITANLTSTTKHAVFSFVGSTNAFPVWFDEYRPGARADTLLTLQQVLRDAYTSQASSKGGMGERWSEITTVPAHAPLIVSGEDAFAETSHTERMVLLNLPVAGKDPAALYRIQEAGTAGLARGYLEWLQWALVAGELPAIVNYEVDGDLPNRQRLNLGVLDLGWGLLTQFLMQYVQQFHPPAPDWSLVVGAATEAATHNPIKDALEWVLDEQESYTFIRQDDAGWVDVRIENFVQYVTRNSSIQLPGGTTAIRRYLCDHYDAEASRTRFPGKPQARTYRFHISKLG